jgi:hypothetical protein
MIGGASFYAGLSFAIPTTSAIWTGVWLVRSVYRIRKFFADRNATDFINTTALLRHALCFSSYLIATIFYSIAFSRAIAY